MSAGYRAEIDGLRALAVLSVLGFHAFPKLIRGGFVGVDIFFVISGFLISGIIYRELERTQQFSLAHFYSRRVKRIFPALIVVLIATLLLGQQVLFADELVELGKNLVASAAFVSNLFLIGHSGYFDGASDQNPLLHLWSLGIEEQFYIFWPVILSLAWKRKTVFGWLVGLIGWSFVLNLVLVDDYPIQTFYLPFTRFWELWAGALLAYATHRWPHGAETGTFTGRAKHGLLVLAPVAPYAGLALLAVGVLFFKAGDTFPGWRAAVPVAGTVLLIAAPRGNLVARRLLSNPVALLVGRVSYPLYVWHWPLLAFLRIQYDHTEIPWHLRVLALGLAFLLAWGTYRLIERPIRFGADSRLKSAALTAAMIGLAAVGLQQWDFHANRHDADSEYVRFYNTYPQSHHLPVEYAFECGFIDGKGKPRSTIDSQCTTAGSRRAVMLWGDSHAQALRYGLSREMPEDASLLQVATFGCHPALVRSASPGDAPCKRSNAFALDAIARVKPEVVVLAQQSNHQDTDWNTFAATLHATGVRQVVVVGPSPEWTPNLYRVMVKEFRPPRPERLTSNLVTDIAATDRFMVDHYGSSTLLTYASIYGLLCDASGCLTTLDRNNVEDLTTFDYGHLSLPASRFVARSLLVPLIRTSVEAMASAASQ